MVARGSMNCVFTSCIFSAPKCTQGCLIARMWADTIRLSEVGGCCEQTPQLLRVVGKASCHRCRAAIAIMAMVIRKAWSNVFICVMSFAVGSAGCGALQDEWSYITAAAAAATTTQMSELLWHCLQRMTPNDASHRHP